MGGGGGADTDLYAVLGLSRECTDADLRLAYRKLAMIWHPDRCSAAGVDEAKERFQEIQGAYSVLSDSNKRFLYDVGVKRRQQRRRRRRRRRRSRSVGDGRLPRRDGADDEPGDANGELRGVAAAVRGHVPRRHRRRPLPVDDAAVMAISVFPSASGDHRCTIAGGGFTQRRQQTVLADDGLRFGRPGHFGLLFQGAMDVTGREHRRRRWQEEKA